MAFPNVADTKKCQTLINIAARAAEQIQAAATILKACRTAFQTADPDPTGTPLEGQVTAVNNWITDVDNVANSAVANGMIAVTRPNHVEEY